jgi:hypothetical protein
MFHNQVSKLIHLQLIIKDKEKTAFW